MVPPKIIFFDIDGTLVDPRTGTVSTRTLHALTSLRQRGILLCISTGRAPSEVPDFSPAVFDAYCTFNGSLCYAGDTILHSTPIAPGDVAQVLLNATQAGRPVSVATRTGLSANGWDQDLADYYRLARLELTPDPHFPAACREPVYQILIGCQPEEHATLIRGVQGVKIAVSWDRAVDIIPAGSGKGVAIRKVLSHFGLDDSQAMAFGDSYNDLEMLQNVGVGVAMGNAADALKAIADDVCGAVSEDGVYAYLLAHDLIDPAPEAP